MALTVLSSSALLSKSLYHPGVLSLLRPFAFYAYRYFSSKPHLYRYRYFKSKPPLHSPVTSSAYRSFNTNIVPNRLSNCSFPMYPNSLSSARLISKSPLLPIAFSILQPIALYSLTSTSLNLLSKSNLCPTALSSLTVSSPGLISKSHLQSIVFSTLPPMARSSYRYFNANPHLFRPDTNGMPHTGLDGLVSRLFSPIMNNVVFKNVMRIIQRRCHWRDTEDYMIIRLYMPGRFKEDVNINVYHNILTIKGERGGRKSCTTHDLSGRHYKIDQIRAKMKCNVLKVVLPKMKEGETTEEWNNNDVINVKVE